MFSHSGFLSFVIEISNQTVIVLEHNPLGENMSNPAAKALRDKLSHLKTGRDSHTPVQDKTKMKEIKMPSMPSMGAPRAPSMAKSEEVVAPEDSLEKNCEESNGGFSDLFKAFDDWKKSEEVYKNVNFKKSEEPLMKPFKSDAQRRAMYAAAEGESTIGIPKKVGKEFVNDSKDQDQSKLPEKVEKSEGMCKSEDLKSALQCLCHECRHNSGLMSRLKLKCACDDCCGSSEVVFEKSEPHADTCRCEACREMLKKMKASSSCK
jgi:hypothetical protein